MSYALKNDVCLSRQQWIPGWRENHSEPNLQPANQGGRRRQDLLVQGMLMVGPTADAILVSEVSRTTIPPGSLIVQRPREYLGVEPGTLTGETMGVGSITTFRKVYPVLLDTFFAAGTVLFSVAAVMALVGVLQTDALGMAFFAAIFLMWYIFSKVGDRIFAHR